MTMSSLSDDDVDVDRPSRGTPARVLPWVLLIGGVVGFAAACVLTYEKIRLTADPSYAPTCNLNAVVNCGSVMASRQAAVLGFPNSFMGVGGFAIVAMVGVALLMRTRLDRWFWAGLQVGVTAAVAFVHWLIVQSLYEIGALCPYCMVVWAVTVPVFWYVTVVNVSALAGPGRTRDLPTRYHAVPLVLWYLVLAGLVVQRFVLG
ncbi:vitamin K epoxide reductase family protein [Rhodococcus sp. SORGH_AS_0303]|uniref:vitamin K epoxide reductase family protein n=1 Tax=Rhodococcus sp. SORGH_AS_0303 TaxID=3041753 RepID=UPI00278B6DD7|nr:putative membrane protein [Rhodococcus sp. SORGH_AS_0303]